MEKYITYVETSVGSRNYSLTIESDEGVNTYNNVYYYIENARIAKVSSGSNHNNGPFQEKEHYNQLRFPVVSTIVSEKKFEY